MHHVRFSALKSSLNRWLGHDDVPPYAGAPRPRVQSSVADLLQPDDIVLDLIVTGRNELFDDIGQHMEWKHGLPKRFVASSLARREQLGSTGLGNGVAIPHARLGEVDRVHLMYLRLKFPIAFDAPDLAPVSDVLMILAPKPASEDHLKILAEVARMFSDARLREQLHRCTLPSQVKQVFDRWSAFYGTSAAARAPTA